ncbi:MAG: CotH kinase family protein [Prevotella sp.]|nr:CotH kinase family protein [Prevotella sp.]
MASKDMSMEGWTRRMAHGAWDAGSWLTAMLLFLFLSCADEPYEGTPSDVPHTGLPFVCLNTPDGADITRNDMDAMLELMEPGSDMSHSFSATVKGRGNTSWIAPKKPYSITFDEPRSPFNLPSGRSWVLLANYHDPAQLRNSLAFYLGSVAGGNSDVPQTCFVDLFVNNLYRGIYQWGESVEGVCSRMGADVILEVDGKARYHETTFHTSHLYHPLTIHLPEVSPDDATFQAITSYVQRAEDALFSEHFTDAVEGYRSYLDVGSFVEWYLVNEIAKNNDAAFYTSCFLHFAWGGKLRMGPPWDFDLSFGDYRYKNRRKIVNDPEGFYLRHVQWYERLFEDPSFKALVKERFLHYDGHREELLAHIDSTAALLESKVFLDNCLWGRLGQKSATMEQTETAYREEVEKLKEWLIHRMDWMRAHLEEL